VSGARDAGYAGVGTIGAVPCRTPRARSHWPPAVAVALLVASAGGMRAAAVVRHVARVPATVVALGSDAGAVVPVARAAPGRGSDLDPAPADVVLVVALGLVLLSWWSARRAGMPVARGTIGYLGRAPPHAPVRHS